MSGHDISVTDGHWIIMLGERGAVGWLSTFGLLVMPVWVAYRGHRREKLRSRHVR